jgi:type IV pilus assembly protein PilB
MIYNEKRLGQSLIEKRIITTAQLEEALKKQKDLELPLGDVLIKMKFVSENLMMDTLSQALQVDYINISENDYQILDKSLQRLLPLEICQKYKVLPVFHFADEETKELTLAMANPFDKAAIDEVENISECHVTPILSHMAAIEGGISKLYSIRQVKSTKIEVEKGNTVSLVNNILKRAVSVGASDIHIEPHANEVHIRMRVDGVLEVSAAYPSQMHQSVTSRIKIMASEKNSLMRIEERRLPQDGSFNAKVTGHEIDCRVSTLPAMFGEKIVMRIFDKDKATYIGRIKDLKMSPRMELKYRRCVRQPSGVNIVTGPTGSGKSTTLHAAMNEINTPGINIVTVEDPVETQASDYINQSSLMPQAGYTYSKALRAIMRQDPDVILIGEVRDLETAEIAIQAALTGHRVFTTLHTEDAAGSVARLVDIGVDSYLVSSTFVSALNQRLVRKVCINCAEEYVPTKIEMLDSGLDEDLADEILKDPSKYTMKMGRGCEHCRKTGYSGRQGVFELIPASREIRDIIVSKQTSDAISESARNSDNINMLFEEGIRLFLSGVTTMGEMQHLPRGEYKLKAIDDIMRDAEL